jgi:hypothetical protein
MDEIFQRIQDVYGIFIGQQCFLIKIHKKLFHKALIKYCNL